MSKILPFTYFGSKWTSFDFINSKLPRTRQYIEPFGGAGTVLLNRDPVPVETINDLHDDIPHFFRVLRDRPSELIDALERTPYSRSEYAHAIEQRAVGYPDCDGLERARLFFTIMQQSRSMRQHSGESNWSYRVRGVDPKTSGADGSTSTMAYRLEQLEAVAGRLKDVQIENRPAIDVIETHDHEDAMLYVDPPYVFESRGSDDNYSLEMDEEEHQELAEVLDTCEGNVAISGYSSELYADLYDEWDCYYAEEKGAGDGDGTRQEVLWTNYDADDLGGKKIGDWPDPRRKGKQLTLTGAIES